MHYTCKKILYNKIHIKFIIVFIILTCLPFLISIKLIDINYIITQNTSLTQVMFKASELPFQYYIPITAGFIYILNDNFYGLEENYIYRFNSRYEWIKEKIIYSVVISIIYMWSIYSLISIIIYFKLGLNITNDFIIYSFITIILNSLVYIIYSMICILVSLLFRNIKNIAIGIVYISILFLTIFGVISDINIIPNNLTLYNYSNINRIMVHGNNIIFAIFLLCTILFILIEGINKIIKYKNLHN